MPFEIKDEFKDTVVGFNNDRTALGQRKDLYLLAEVALNRDGTVKDAQIMGMFKDPLPTLDEIKAQKQASFNQKQAGKAVVVNPVAAAPAQNVAAK